MPEIFMLSLWQKWLAERLAEQIDEEIMNYYISEDLTFKPPDIKDLPGSKKLPSIIDKVEKEANNA